MTKEESDKILDILKQCAWKFSARFNYKNAKGIKSQKKVEVYNIDEQKLSFFAYDLKDECPKTFKIEQMRDFIDICEEFKPRYER